MHTVYILISILCHYPVIPGNCTIVETKITYTEGKKCQEELHSNYLFYKDSEIIYSGICDIRKIK